MKYRRTSLSEITLIRDKVRLHHSGRMLHSISISSPIKSEKNELKRFNGWQLAKMKKEYS